MKVYEIIESKNSNIVNENFLLKGIWGIIVAMGLWKPITQAWTNIKQAIDANTQGAITDDQRDSIVDHELATVSISIAGILIGNHLISKIAGLFKVINLFGNSVFSRLLTKVWNTIISAGSPYAQYEFMNYINSPAGAGIIADWLTGNLFVKQIKITGGPTYEKYIGSNIENGLLNISKYAKKLLDQEEPTDQTEPANDIQQPTASTSPSSTNKFAPKKQQWADPNEPTYSSSLKRNPETGELELK